MKEKNLTYTQKMTELEKLQKKYKIVFEIVHWNNNETIGQAEDKISYDCLGWSDTTNILDVALACEDRMGRNKWTNKDSDYRCIEIVYGPDNHPIWHMDDEKCDPEISDENFERFINWCNTLQNNRGK